MAHDEVEIISAPSVLGLSPSGVERLGESLLACGLAERLHVKRPVIYVPALNDRYSRQRDADTHCINTAAIKEFSVSLGNALSESVNNGCFPLVLGGDCSILLGIMPALKSKGTLGLIFLDAHADFYEPEKSITGEVADMDLAMVTGRGPEVLTNLQGHKPYVKDENVIHIGQRDWEETRKYGSQDIKKTNIKSFGLEYIEKKGITITAEELLQHAKRLQVEGLWIHFDTDVLSDEVNPAVDYRLPGGLQFSEVEYLIKALLSTGRIVGMSVTIFNPALDTERTVAKNITETLARAFNSTGLTSCSLKR